MIGFLRLPEAPLPSRPINIDATTSPGRLVVRAMFSINRLTIPAAALMAVQQASQAAVPIAMGLAIDRALAANDRGALVVWLVLLVGLYGVLAVAYRLAFRMEIMAMQLVCYQVRLRVADAVLDARRESRQLPGVALSIFTTDVNRLGQSPGLLVYPFGDLVAITIVAVVLFVIAWPLGVVVLVGTPLMLWTLGRAAGPLQRRSFHQLQQVGDATGTAADLIAGLRVVKGLGAEAVATQRYRRVSQQALRATLRVESSQAAYEVLTDLVAGVFIAGVAILIGALALGGDMTVGELVTTVGLAQSVMGPVQSLTKDFGVRLAEAKASAQRVLGVLQVPRRATGEVGLVATIASPRLELRGVTIGDLRRLDVTVESGETVGVVTDSTSAQLLEDALGLRRPLDGGELIVGANRWRPSTTTRSAASCSSLRTAPISSTDRCSRTSMCVGRRTRRVRSSRRRSRRPPVPTSSPPSPTGCRRGWARVASCCRVVSANEWPWPGRWPPPRPSWCSTNRPRPSTRSPSRSSRPDCGASGPG